MVSKGRQKLAIITTFWDWRSHANHMGERFLCGYPRDGRWHRPDFDVVGVFVDQSSEEDLSQRRAEDMHFQRACGPTPVRFRHVKALTGTGVVPDDDFTLADDDVIRITISGIGTLENPVATV